MGSAEREELAAAEARIDRRIKVWPAVQTLLMFVILVVGAAGLMFGYATTAATTAVDHGNHVRECTTKESAKVTQAQTDLIRAGQARDSATQEYLQASATGDAATQERLLAEAPELRADVESLSTALDEANQNYQAKLVQSREHPTAFLAECALDE